MYLLVKNNHGIVWYWAEVKPGEPFFLVGDTNTYMLTDQPAEDKTIKELAELFPPTERSFLLSPESAREMVRQRIREDPSISAKKPPNPES